MASIDINPWAVSQDDFPASAPPIERLLFLLNYAVLAPSSHNSQPWRFRAGADEIELLADRGRRLPVVDPDDRELVISCGAALLQLRVALRFFGYAGQVKLLPDPEDRDLLARVALGERHERDTDDNRLFRAIGMRRTNRSAFQDRPIPEALLAACASAARAEGAWLKRIETPTERNSLAELVAQGDELQWKDKAFRYELAAWLRTNRSERNDGMPGYAFQLKDWASAIAPPLMRLFDMGKGQAAIDRRFVLAAPVLLVLGTDADRPRDWLAAGQALGAVFLRANAEGVALAFLNQPVEVAGLRHRLRDALRLQGCAQLVMRLGYAQPVRATPRRNVREVLIAAE